MNPQMLDIAAPTACILEEKLPWLLDSPDRHQILTIIVYTALLLYDDARQGFPIPEPSTN